MPHHPRARHLRPFAHAAAAALLGAALGGCESEAAKEPPKAAPAAPAASAGPKASAPAAAKPAVKRLEWDDPPQWKRVPPTSSMRMASYHIPPAAGEKEIAELNVFVLGGDVESNITRWVNEFSGFDPKTLSRADRVVNDMSQAVVEIPKGKFNGGMSETGPSEDFALLGAIVVTPEDAKYFFKLTGPSATVQASRAPFYALLDSVRLEGGKAAPETAKTVEVTGAAAGQNAPASAKGEPAKEAAGQSPPAKH